jgi:hypothetical protein
MCLMVGGWLYSRPREVEYLRLPTYPRRTSLRKSKAFNNFKEHMN